MTGIDDAAEILARHLRPANPPHAHGWGALVEPCRTALLELIAAGWTPPGDNGGDGHDERGRLRAEIGRLSRLLDDLNCHLDRLVTEEQAFGEFRGLLVQVAHPCGRNPLRLDPDRAYTAGEVQAWVVRLLDAADGRADAARRQAAKNAARRASAQERAQLALFDPAPATGDCGDGYFAPPPARTVDTVTAVGSYL